MREKKKAKKAVPVKPQITVDYDDSDPYSCIAAGAAERGLNLYSTEDLVYSIYPSRSSARIKALTGKDRNGVVDALRKIWGRAHGRQVYDEQLAWWAAEHLKALGDSTLVERERNYRRHPE